MILYDTFLEKRYQALRCICYGTYTIKIGILLLMTKGTNMEKTKGQCNIVFDSNYAFPQTHFPGRLFWFVI